MVNANHHGASRHLNNSSQWAAWWPGEAPLIYNGQHYTINPVTMDVINIVVSNDNMTIPGYIKIYPVSTDTLSIHWEFVKTSSSNPIQRIKNYFFTRQLNKNFHHIMEVMKEFMETPKNLYGIEVQQTTVTDTILMTIKTEINHYPQTEDVYKLVEKLRDYIKRSHAQETNEPMLNILEIDSARYQYMVAIPVNKALPGKGEIKMKRMIPGNILVTEIRGGEETIADAFKSFDNLVSDYRKTSPAIPFQSLITNRQEVRDTSRWITKLYYPIH